MFQKSEITRVGFSRFSIAFEPFCISSLLGNFTVIDHADSDFICESLEKSTNSAVLKLI